MIFKRMLYKAGVDSAGVPAGRLRPLLFLKFMLALCSMAYELLLAQILSAFFANTVLRYSVTIGLYMCFMGVGAFVADRYVANRPWRLLFKVETLLILLGVSAVPGLFFLDALNVSSGFLLLWAHMLVISIGFLTGFELPLLLALGDSELKSDRNRLIAFDYLGAFAGTVLYVFCLYPLSGLLPSLMAVASCNAVGVLFLVLVWRPEFGTRVRVYWRGAILLLLLTLAGLAWSGRIQEVCVRLYLHEEVL